MCQRAQRDGFKPGLHCRGIETVEKCPIGQVPKLSEGNQRFWHLFSRLLPGLFDGYGGISYSAIAFFIDLFKIEQKDVFFEKSIIIATTIRQIQEERQKRRGKR